MIAISRVRPLAAALLLALPWLAAAQTPYQRPPSAILEALNAPPLPQWAPSPDRTRILVTESRRYPPISELARPFLRLAGLRVDPSTNGPYSPPQIAKMSVLDIVSGKERAVAVPAGARIGSPAWSPDGKRLLFSRTTESAVEIWVADASTGRSRRVVGRASAAFGTAARWMPGSRSVLVQLVPPGRPKPPRPPAAPSGPDIQESQGRRSNVRTYQDLLTGPHDEALFDYYCTSQLALVDADTGRSRLIGRPAIFSAVEPSPDGAYLLVTTVRRPYSYLLPATSFPRATEIWDIEGNTVKSLTSEAAREEERPDQVTPRPRSFQWKPTEPNTLLWVVSNRGGDRILESRPPFAEDGTEIARTTARFAGMVWSADGKMVLISEGSAARRETRTLAHWPGTTEKPALLWTRTADRYADPGTPLMVTLPSGGRTLQQDGDYLYLTGAGASPEGDRPFLDRYHIRTGERQRLFQSAPDRYEQVLALRDGGTLAIIRRESENEPPNLHEVPLQAGGTARALTAVKDPFPLLRSIRKQRVTYKREDGVQCSFTLYLPPGYTPGTRLPTVLWAYPREFADADIAGQIIGSTERFTTLASTSHLFFLLDGYAILDNASMPVVGPPRTANDTYIEQIVMSAKAAIEKAAEMGVTDPDRVGVGGHSYGAFMTANLLAHSDLFRAGIARSGAYNRTLTPFGFQAEQRTLWQARDTYLRMSPFLYADKINEPLLLIHGMADNNPGTFPIQTERLFQAIRGTGGKARAVMLPLESHGYMARESVEHVLWEMLTWFDQHVKRAPPRAKPTAPETPPPMDDVPPASD